QECCAPALLRSNPDGLFDVIRRGSPAECCTSPSSPCVPANTPELGGVMYASRSGFPKEQDQQRGHDVVPFAAKDWPPEAVRDLDEPGRARRRAGPSMRPARSAADEPEGNTASARPSFGRRVIRGLFRFVIAVMIGVGLTLGLQMHGHEVRDAARIWAPAVASLLDGLLPVIASTNSGASTVAAPATFADLVQQVGPLQQDLAGVRRSIDELAARQDQLVQAIAALQAAGQDL